MCVCIHLRWGGGRVDRAPETAKHGRKRKAVHPKRSEKWAEGQQKLIRVDWHSFVARFVFERQFVFGEPRVHTPLHQVGNICWTVAFTKHPKIMDLYFLCIGMPQQLHV